MSDLIANWLNNEIELSKVGASRADPPQTVTPESVERDFANGYLFGELLFKFNQQSNFKEFQNK